MIDLIGTEAKIWDVLRELFPVHVVGAPSAVSEFGGEYMTWRNGRIVPEGEFAPVWAVEITSAESILAAVRGWFEPHARVISLQVIVWRELPDVSVYPAVTEGMARDWQMPVLPERYGVYMRFHFMRWWEYQNAIERRLPSMVRRETPRRPE